MNKERLLKLADFLGTVPDEQFFMGVWQRRQPTEANSCGTVGCALGWACEIPEFKAAGLRLVELSGTDDSFPAYKCFGAFDAGSAFFGISYNESRWLFDGEKYEQDDAYHDVKPAEVSARIRELVAHEDAKADADLKNENP